MTIKYHCVQFEDGILVGNMNPEMAFLGDPEAAPAVMDLIRVMLLINRPSLILFQADSAFGYQMRRVISEAGPKGEIPVTGLDLTHIPQVCDEVFIVTPVGFSETMKFIDECEYRETPCTLFY